MLQPDGGEHGTSLYPQLGVNNAVRHGKNDMTRPVISTAIFFTVALSIQAMANQPAYIQATKAEYTFSVNIPDPKGPGEILVQIEQSASKHFLKLRISAFGKTFDLSKALLSELDNYSCSGLTAMRGYDEIMDSQAIYLRFSMAVFDQASPTAVVVVSESGEIKIRKTRQANPPNKTLEGILQPVGGSPKNSI